MGETNIYSELIKNKYIKILKPTAARLEIEKEFYVCDNFADGYYSNVKQYSYSNEMLYAYSGAEFIQERGKEKQVAYNSSVGFNSFGFDYSNTHFPIWTSDYILYALYPEYSSDYTQQYQYLLLAPPMNAYSIRQREYDQYSMQEFFLHFDEKYVVRMKRDYISTKVDIWMLNGKTMQTVEIAQNGQFMPIVSESGEYIVVASMVIRNY